MTSVLVLNSGFLPVDIISDREAISLIYQNKAYPVVESEREMRSPSVTIKVPYVLALFTYNTVHKRKVKFSRLNVLYRDDQVCQYCGKQFNINELTVDHVIPKSRWKEVKRTSKRNWTNWLNCVAACKWCNNKKGNKLLDEAHMKLINKPYEPKYMPFLEITHKEAEKKGWLPFCNYNVRLVYR